MGPHHSAVEHFVAQQAAIVAVFRNAFGQNMQGAFNRFVERVDAFFEIDELLGARLHRFVTVLLPDVIGERLKPAIDGEPCLALTLGLERKIEVFEVALGDGAVDLVAQFVGQQALLLNRRQEDRKSTRLNSSHVSESRMPSSA